MIAEITDPTAFQPGGKDVIWTKPKLRKFRRVYALAYATRQPDFKFGGRIYDTAFAGYLITHLVDKLGMKDK